MSDRSASTKTLPVVQSIPPSKIFCNAIVEERPEGMRSVKGAGIWLMDRGFRVVWMNETMEEIYGSLEMSRGESCFKVFRGRTSRCLDCLPSRVFETGSIVSGHIQRITQDGLQRYFQVVDAPLVDAENQVAHILEIVMDVTEKTRMEQALRESENEYRALFEHAGTAVAVSNRAGILTRVNEAFERLSGYKRHEIENRFHYLQFVHPRDRNRLEELTRRRFSDPRSVPDRYGFALMNRQGEECIIDIFVSMLENGDQIVSLIDVSEKRKLEKEVRSKEQFLANILNHSLDGIAAIDMKGILRSWNHGAELMFGYEPAQILGRPFTTLFAPRFRRSRRMSEIAKLFRGQGFLRNFVAETLTRDGRKLMVDITRTTLRDAEGNEIGSSAIIRDVTEKLRTEHRTLQQEKMSAMGELAASLAHEIKNPLNSMVINMEVLRGHLFDLPPPKRTEIQKYVDVFSLETSRLDRVMKNFLDFARPVVLKFEKVRLETVLNHVLQLVTSQAERQKIKIRTDFAKDLPFIEGSEDHLKQVFLNLLLNAIQAMPDGGRITVSIRADADNTLIVKVADNGVGIPRQNFNKIFNLYFSTKEKGSGLGLPLVKRLVSAHGATVNLESRSQHGTTFVIKFPTV